MLQRFHLLMAMAFLCTSSGCLARQVNRDGLGFREAVLDLYTQQALDNLIRAHDGMPFVQLTYRDLLIQDTDSVTANASDVGFVQRLATSGPLGAIATIARTTSNSLTLGGTAKRDRLMSFHADPVTDKNDIYELYLAFASDPGLFVVSDTKPKCAHIMKKCGHKYYWVPPESGSVFQHLVLATTFMRGSKSPPLGYYERNVIRVESDPPFEVENADMRILLLTFDKAVKNAAGFMEFEFKPGQTSEIALEKITTVTKRRFKKTIEDAIDKKTLDKTLDEGIDTPYLQATWMKEREKFDPQKLTGKAVRVFLPNYPPPQTKSSPELQRILDNLDAIRANVPKIIQSP